MCVCLCVLKIWVDNAYVREETLQGSGELILPVMQLKKQKKQLHTSTYIFKVKNIQKQKPLNFMRLLIVLNKKEQYIVLFNVR